MSLYDMVQQFSFKTKIVLRSLVAGKKRTIFQLPVALCPPSNSHIPGMRTSAYGPHTPWTKCGRGTVNMWQVEVPHTSAANVIHVHKNLTMKTANVPYPFADQWEHPRDKQRDRGLQHKHLSKMYQQEFQDLILVVRQQKKSSPRRQVCREI